MTQPKKLAKSEMCWLRSLEVSLARQKFNTSTLLSITLDRDVLFGSGGRRPCGKAIDCSERQAIAFRLVRLLRPRMRSICLSGQRGGVTQTEKASAHNARQDELLPKVSGCAWQRPHAKTVHTA